ncbi:35949_t:CDS:2, partial [Racocetra persica]
NDKNQVYLKLKILTRLESDERFAGNGSCASYWTKEDGQCLSINYKRHTRREDYGLNIANSIVNQQNSGLQSMDTEQILDLFNVTTDISKGVQSKSASFTSDGSGFGKGKKITPKNLVEGLENLWDDKQYEDLNLDNFIESLNSER